MISIGQAFLPLEKIFNFIRLSAPIKKPHKVEIYQLCLFQK